MKDIKIGKYTVGPSSKPFVVAEMSGNHNQSIDRAFQIVDAAAAAGAHAIKLQTYTADTMTLDVKASGFVIEDKESLWAGKSLHKLYQEAYTPWEWHKPIFDRCKEKGMIGFSSPFDETAVDFLESLEVPAYKIASFELLDLPLIAKVARIGKPMIMSTGMAKLSEIEEAVECARKAGAKDIILLKCTSTYPATPENSNISTIPHLREAFGTQVGLSDHTLGVGVAVASVALGATFLEKHFTLRRSDGGVDSAFSLEPEELKALCVESERAWQGVGKVSYGTSSEKEQKSIQFRRSLYISKDIKPGEKFTNDNMRIVRPGYGLPPKYMEILLGKTASKALPAGTPVTWEIFE